MGSHGHPARIPYPGTVLEAVLETTMLGVNRRVGAFNRSMAVILAVAVTVQWAPVTMAVGPAGVPLAEIRGSVLAADGLTAVVGVSVKAANMRTHEIYSSGLTGDNGAYSLK